MCPPSVTEALDALQLMTENKMPRMYLHMTHSSQQRKQTWHKFDPNLCHLTGSVHVPPISHWSARCSSIDDGKQNAENVLTHDSFLATAETNVTQIRSQFVSFNRFCTCAPHQSLKRSMLFNWWRKTKCRECTYTWLIPRNSGNKRDTNSIPICVI